MRILCKIWAYVLGFFASLGFYMFLVGACAMPNFMALLVR